MSKSRDPMKSHFCVTIWKHNNEIITEKLDKENYYNFEEIINGIQDVVRMCRGHYYCFSVEDSRLKQVVEPVVEISEPLREPEISTPVSFPSDSKLGQTSLVQASRSDSARGGVHIHVYMELQRTMRWSTVVNKFQKNGFEGSHVEIRKGWRETCREYHMGVKNYEPKLDAIISGEWGKWREELGNSYSKEDYFELAANMILHGYRPNQVAMRFPTWYIRHGYGVERLYSSINRENWDDL